MVEYMTRSYMKHTCKLKQNPRSEALATDSLCGYIGFLWKGLAKLGKALLTVHTSCLSFQPSGNFVANQANFVLPCLGVAQEHFFSS